jgi:hypothetical protein
MKVAVQIYDEVRKGDNKPMGSTTFDIAEVLGSRGNTKARKIKGGGTIFCHVAKSTGSGLLRLGMSATKLKNTEGLMRKSDPFFELSCKRDASGSLTWDNVFRSDVVKDNLNPQWKDAIVPLSHLNQGDLDKPILITVYDFESKGDHVLMGQVETSVKALEGLVGSSLTLKKRGSATGTLNIQKAEVAGVEDVIHKMASASVSAPAPAAFVPSVVPSSASSPSFVDYISGGCELNVCVAIDFTGSNGDPRQPGTLHHLNQDGSKNNYEKAVSAIVGILSKYDSDQMYPVWGFGAKYGGVVRHCFQCGPTAEAHGVAGILDAYHQTFKSGLIMSGPTVFTEVMETAAAKAMSSQEAAKSQGRQSYTILLILTDGAVTDSAATAQVLRQISNAPLSVVIVGLGDADFSSMQFLDDVCTGDSDIAQFVAFNQHSKNSVELTSETLREIPDQLVKYFQRNKIQPLAAIVRGDDEIVVEAEEEEIDLTLDFGDDGEIVVAAGGDDFVTGFGA